MQHLTFGEIHPHENGILQQIIQGTPFCSMSFNQRAYPIFMARTPTGIAGFTTGHKGSGNESHVLIIQGTYLFNQYNDEQHQSELQLAFIHYAEKKLNVTHYKINEYDTPKEICVRHLMPPPKAEISDAPDAPLAFSDMPIPERHYA